ncbi:MAG TPA: DUF3108 domain-containing protein [Thermoanaerobaculia bacterium]|nr:DUF3108 domain-containing protein [Thermoanaerobaculia bacterium]
MSASAFGADLTCNSISNTEELHYSWRLRGGVRFLAGLVFPTSGVGNLKTTYGENIHSELLITAPNGKQGGYYAYESDIDETGKTLMTYHGYAWGKKSRAERTIFDYVKGLARIRKQTPEEVENRVKKLPSGSDEFRDILTAIHYLRQNANGITRPMQTTIYSDGKEYPVIFQRGERKNFVIEGKNTIAQGFRIVDAPGGKKWPGGVTVWLSADERHVPVRIEIQQSMASLQLDLQKVESCATLMARL